MLAKAGALDEASQEVDKLDPATASPLRDDLAAQRKTK
jgi:hypothetical protein